MSIYLCKLVKYFVKTLSRLITSIRLTFSNTSFANPGEHYKDSELNHMSCLLYSKQFPHTSSQAVKSDTLNDHRLFVSLFFAQCYLLIKNIITPKS